MIVIVFLRYLVFAIRELFGEGSGQLASVEIFLYRREIRRLTEQGSQITGKEKKHVYDTDHYSSSFRHRRIAHLASQ